MVVLSLGTNLGDRFANMNQMETMVESILYGTILKSPLYETEPVGVSGGHQPYLNRIMAGSYEGSPEQLLEETQRIELSLGRTDKGKLAPRSADIDILLIDDLVIKSDRLTVPHHALFERRFEIEGVQAILPDMKIPQSDFRFSEFELTEELKKQQLTIIE